MCLFFISDYFGKKNKEGFIKCKRCTKVCRIGLEKGNTEQKAEKTVHQEYTRKYEL